MRGGTRRKQSSRDADASFRVALVSSSFAPHIGGVETHVARVAAGLKTRGHAVEVWTVDRGEGIGVRSVDGIVTRVMPAPLPTASFRGLSRFLRVVPRAWRMWASAYSSFAPTVVHVHCFGPNGAYALALNRRFPVRLFVTSHGETFMDDNRLFETSTIMRRALRSALTRAEVVTGPSRVVLSDLTARFGLQGGVTIPNGVDPSIRPRHNRTKGRYILAVGRLGVTKGFDLLLEAFALADLPDDVSLVIGGDGPERGGLDRRAAELGIASRVRFVGWLDEQAIADLMGGSTAVVVPSRIEAFGIVALEAWRAGAPLLMTRHGGATEFMRDGHDAILIDPHNVHASAEAIRRIFSDARLRRKIASGGAVSVRGFTWESVVDRYVSLYSSRPTPR
ncbi:glycosyltransferase family 4 protein [Microbacterium sp. ARD31]|uniref:glycosyltransferase family 4 protein n=1 Tax=Microbacterium sp. ARD31 TaxID=2962576 RepID=UPI0028816907|nr:glycosyltransferase family 4 protein [Microbacterium sp. ARD31]MDT0186469.1 glycosyltransferase family 4 protein [Microbacterium sp. ARD31]